MVELTSSAISPPASGDAVWGDGGPEAIVYLDLSCPQCAVSWHRARELPLRLWLRHFPIASKRPRAPALHAAAEAAGRQMRFAEMWDAILIDPAHIDDPHIWQRAQTLDLDLERFERDRRSAEVSATVRSQFEGAIRGGVTGAPTAVVAGSVVTGGFDLALSELASAAD